MGAAMSEDDPIKEPKMNPRDRAERTQAAFREIVDRDKVKEDAKTARLRDARLKRDAAAQPKTKR
jgi:hypothetical protein